MGKDWWYWVGGRRGRGGGCSKRGKMPGEMKEAAASAGCMCAVLHLFDLHRFQFASDVQNPSEFRSDNYPFLQEEATTYKGVEAPRNSLELEEPAAMNVASLSILDMKQEDENLNFPVGIEIKTSHGKISSPRFSTSASKSRLDDFSSECSSSSPGTKTPSVVARLMGLDLLPAECNSPAISSSSHKRSRLRQRKDINLLRSRSSRSFFDDSRLLPETPRISSTRRSDVELRRLSLQINKEYTNEEFALADGMSAGRGKFRLWQQDENTSPGSYAKQIVKNVKDNLSRRVGLDITNTKYRNREQYYRKDENLVLLKPTKKNSKISSRIEGEITPDSDQSNPPSCSPKLKLLDQNKNKMTTATTTTTSRLIKSSRILSSVDNHQSKRITYMSKSKPQMTIPSLEQQHQLQQKDSKNAGSTKICSSSRLRNKKEDQFVRSTATSKLCFTDKKLKKTPLSNEILNINGPTLLQVKKCRSLPPTKLPQKQSQVSDAIPSKSSTQLSSYTSQTYKLQPDKMFTFPESILPTTTNGSAIALHGGSSAEYGNYIQRILEVAGIINNVSPLALAKWHTLSHPIDPSIFHHLELFHPTTTYFANADTGGCNSVLEYRCNRKLIFHLVDELLAEILTPNFYLNPWITPISKYDHSQLVVGICKKIDGFPAANCLVLEDIDSLIDKDLRMSHLNGFVNEEENIMREFEDEILEWLVRETVAEMGGDANSNILLDQ